MKSGEVIAISAFMIIIIGIAFALAGPGTRVGTAWNCGYLKQCDQGAQQSQQQSLPPTSGSSVLGGPSLSAARIDSILSQAGSPAVGTGQVFYNDSLTYGIDDAFGLAFFHHESGFGTSGAATQTLSIGNIICTSGYPCIGRFRAYPSWSAGIDDWYKLIKNEYVGKGLTTVSQIIYTYAPRSDGNNPESYISAVEGDVQTWRSM